MMQLMRLGSWVVADDVLGGTGYLTLLGIAVLTLFLLVFAGVQRRFLGPVLVLGVVLEQRCVAAGTVGACTQVKQRVSQGL